MMPDGLPYQWHGSPSELIGFTIKFFSISKGHLLGSRLIFFLGQ